MSLEHSLGERVAAEKAGKREWDQIINLQLGGSCFNLLRENVLQ
jgi:hypothetical protein